MIREWMEQDFERLNYMGYSEELIEGLIMTERLDAREEGLAEGRAVGLAEGRAEGRAEARAEMVRSYARTVAGMLSMGHTLEEAMGLVPEEISEDVRRSLA
ncbi:MAG: hypothetical protein J5674_02770 [Candidatus Methanomethylophilaceae archaeon]|nr:hypothetical protein [Candidatus Methanomethylophilaceae archaeon]